MKLPGPRSLFRALKRGATVLFRWFAVCVITLVSRAKFNVRVDNRAGKLAPGAVFLCNHTCIWDFSFLIAALFPRYLRFVATSIEFEKNRLYAWVLTVLGVIRKKQGAPDSASVRNMLRASRAGESIALYPAGMTSFDGRAAWDAQEGTGKLVKLIDAEVYAVIVNGGFISFPRYAHATYRGRVDVTITRLFAREELKTLSADEAQRRINAALQFNDWDWQTKNNVAFRGKDNVQNVCNTLYKCPNCLREGEMRAQDGNLRCFACGMTVRRDARGFFSCDTGNCFARMDEWFDMEKDSLRKEIENPAFALRARVRLLVPGDKGYREADAGELTMTRDALIFAGGADRLVWRLTDFQYFVLNDRDFLHIYTRDGAYRFVFGDTKLITKWFLAHKMIVACT